MKHTIFTLFITLITSVGTVFASNTVVNNIWYDFDDITQTAIVTYKGETYYSYGQEYSGAITIPTTVTYIHKTYNVVGINEYAFYGCSNLTSVVISEGITSIGLYAFRGCTRLNSVTLPSTIQHISMGVFSETGIQSNTNNWENGVLYVGNSLISAHSNDVTGDYTIKANTTCIADGALYGCTELTSITIPNSVAYIGDEAFAWCEGLTSINIPSSVVTIGVQPFFCCWSLTEINVDVNNANYCSVDGVLFSKDTTILIECPQDFGVLEYTIPASVSAIEEYAFYRCKIATISAESVINIKKQAFAECKALTTINMGNSVTNIGRAAFISCDSLTNIVIPSSVISIEENAFYYCRSLSSITNYAAEPQVITSSVFDGVNKTNCILYVLPESIDLYSDAEVWRDFGTILPINSDPTAISLVNCDTNSTKVIKNGQILILRGNRTYTLTGQEVK